MPRLLLDMTTNWTKEFTDLSSDDLDSIAVLRVMECTNGIIQHRFRDGDDDALDADETRTAMKFSMGSIKRMQIELEDGPVTFSDSAKELMGRVRELYISGVKRNNDADYAEFMKSSVASLTACGLPRLFEAKARLYNQCYEYPSYTYDWGLAYILSLLIEG
jgi:hypothetical protein